MSDLATKTHEPYPRPLSSSTPSPPRTAWRLNARSVRTGVIAAAAMALFYVVVVRGASGSWEHLAEQGRADWYYLLAIIVGFGTQVALVTELRRRHRPGSTATVPGAVGAGASTAGMIACCAHHLAELLPIIGAVSAAGFLTDYRVPFLVAGITINTIAVIVVARALRHHTAMHPTAAA